MQSNEGFITSSQQRLRMKYYEKCRQMIITEENRRRASVIEEEGEDGETVSLLGPASINHFLVKNKLLTFLLKKKQILMNFFFAGISSSPFTAFLFSNYSSWSKCP